MKVEKGARGGRVTKRRKKKGMNELDRRMNWKERKKQRARENRVSVRGRGFWPFHGQNQCARVTGSTRGS